MSEELKVENAFKDEKELGKAVEQANEIINRFQETDNIIKELTDDVEIVMDVASSDYNQKLEYFVTKYTYLLAVRDKLPTELRRIQYHISSIYKGRSGPIKAISKLINQLEKAKSMQWSNENVQSGNEEAKTIQSDQA